MCAVLHIPKCKYRMVNFGCCFFHIAVVEDIGVMS